MSKIPRVCCANSGFLAYWDTDQHIFMKLQSWVRENGRLPSFVIKGTDDGVRPKTLSSKYEARPACFLHRNIFRKNGRTPAEYAKEFSESGQECEFFRQWVPGLSPRNA